MTIAPQFTDFDVVNIDDFIPDGESHPHNVRPWLIHDHGFTLAVVFASNLQDAFDEAADAGKLDTFLVDESDYEEYGVNTDEPTCSFLGNEGRPFDIDGLAVAELRNPPASFFALYRAALEG